MWRGMLLAGMAAVGLGLAGGCVSGVNTTENLEKTMERDHVDTKRVVTDGFLRDRLVVLRVDRAETDGGLLQVQVTVRNTRTGFWDKMWHGDNPYKIAYRFSWLDERGMEVATATSIWVEKDIIPGDTVTIAGIAPNPRCKDFLLRMREL